MRHLALALIAALFASCAAVPSDHASVDLEQALQADLFPSGSIDLNRELEAGRPIALVFWQAWCGSCVAEAPAVQAAFDTYGKRIKIIGVVSGPDAAVDEGKLLRTIAALGLTYDQIRDRDLALTDRFEVTGTPTIVILDTDGQVVYDQHHVPDSWETYL